MLKNILNKLHFTAVSLRQNLSENNHGFGTLEMVLIILIILGILVIFRSNIEDLINSIFSKIDSQVSSF